MHITGYKKRVYYLQLDSKGQEMPKTCCELISQDSGKLPGVDRASTAHAPFSALQRDPGKQHCMGFIPYGHMTCGAETLMESCF